MTISGLEEARAHWLLGAFFLAIILEQYLPLLGRDGRPLRERTLLTPVVLLLTGVSVWGTTVFAGDVHDTLVHSVWGDILFAAGALELARRRRVYERPWLDYVIPLTIVSCGVLFVLHTVGETSGTEARWHLALGLLLTLAGLIDTIRVKRRSTAPVPFTLVPLTAFALVLMAYPG